MREEEERGGGEGERRREMREGEETCWKSLSCPFEVSSLQLYH